MTTEPSSLDNTPAPPTSPPPLKGHVSLPLTQRQLLGIYATVYLVCAIVVLRCMMMSPDEAGPHRQLVFGGIAALAGSFGWFHLSPPQTRRTMLMVFAFQSSLILSMSVAAPAYFLTLLFFLPVITNFMLYFPGTSGMIGISLFTMCSLGLRWIVYSRPPEEPRHYLIYAGFFLIGSYINMFSQAKEAHQESQLLLQELQESHAQLQAHAEQIEELAITQERNRLARELHDSVSQMLFSITFLTQSAMMRLDRKPDEAKKPIQQIQSTAESALKEMRALIFQLRPPQDATDFIALLRDLIAEIQHRHPLQPTLDVPESLSLPPGITHHLFRIIQEALHNVVKHTASQEVALRIDCSHEQLSIELQDQGPGFDPSSQRERSSFGLKIMQERAEIIGAALAFHVGSGSGTTVSLALPWPVTKDITRPESPDATKPTAPNDNPAHHRERDEQKHDDNAD